MGGTTIWSSLLPLPGRDRQGPLSRLPITTFSWPHHFRVFSGPFPYALNVKTVGGQKVKEGLPSPALLAQESLSALAVSSGSSLSPFSQVPNLLP